jgi:Putative addiction module component
MPQKGTKTQKGLVKALRALCFFVTSFSCIVRMSYGYGMATQADKLVTEIRALPDEEKLRVLDAILTDLDKPDQEIDQVWAEEARKRWSRYKAGHLQTVSYEELMRKYNR